MFAEAELGPSVEPRSTSGVLQFLVFGAAVLLALFAWITPNHYPPWLTFHGELSDGRSVAGAVIVAVLARCNASFRSPPALTIAAFATILIPAGQFALGQVEFIGDVWMTSLSSRWLRPLDLGRASRRFGSSGWIVCWSRWRGSCLAGAVISKPGVALYQWQGLEYLEFFVIEDPGAVAPVREPDPAQQPRHVARPGPELATAGLSTQAGCSTLSRQFLLRSSASVSQ